MTISDRIETLRIKRGITLAHLNSTIGAYRGKLTEVRKGKASFSDYEIAILARELSTTTDYLLGNTDDPSQNEKSATDVPAAQDEVDRELYALISKLSPAKKALVLEKVKEIEKI